MAVHATYNTAVLGFQWIALLTQRSLGAPATAGPPDVQSPTMRRPPKRTARPLSQQGRESATLNAQSIDQMLIHMPRRSGRMPHAPRRVAARGESPMPLHAVPRRSFSPRTPPPSRCRSTGAGACCACGLLVSAAWIMGWSIYLIVQRARGRVQDQRFPRLPGSPVRAAGGIPDLRRRDRLGVPGVSGSKPRSEGEEAGVRLRASDAAVRLGCLAKAGAPNS